MENGRKRGNLDSTFVSNGGFKKSKQESEFLGSGVGSKSKPCTKFFSTTGCQYGESCHFLHYVPGGFNAVSQMTKTGRDSRNPMTAPPPPLQLHSDGPAPTVKTKLCNKFNTAEGCKFGDQCRFAHGEIELGKRNFPSHEDPRGGGMGPPMASRQQPTRFDPAPHGSSSAVANFGVSATAKISIDGSVAGAVIGKGGVISKEICRLTGVRLAVRDHESDPNKKNIELEGTFDQINHASSMVQEILVNVGVGTGNNNNNNSINNNTNSRKTDNVKTLKTKLCENFARGLCTYGEKCRFAHGESDLRQPGA
ncbi:zinc finger CCCH domain-containing protein 14-like [Impatiens glandulifera]|uniref:zinc finger CCCH domain-containing protein 14-like n=1 Tax=Impatiens glandulifera TaxID=253017 RepID=UPI001FB1A11D|nr:zinc finger CCCH domain-containing protein 14-like [Impatiens glandulifera]